jgi:hypothetical protein
VPECKAAAGANLGLIAGGDFDGESGGHGDRDAGLEEHVLDRPQIHTGILAGAMDIGGQRGVGAQSLDVDSQSAMINVFPRPVLKEMECPSTSPSES